MTEIDGLFKDNRFKDLDDYYKKISIPLGSLFIEKQSKKNKKIKNKKKL